MKTLALLTLLAATPALAECPIAGDLSSGIRVYDTVGGVETFLEIGNTVVQADFRDSTGFASRVLLGKGTHVLRSGDVENGRMVNDSITITTYPYPNVSLPIPAPRSKWDISTSVNQYGDIIAEQQSQVWRRATTLTIGDCTLNAIRGKVTYARAGSTLIEDVAYFPDLGFTLLLSFKFTDEPGDTFTFTRIEAVQ